MRVDREVIQRLVTLGVLLLLMAVMAVLTPTFLTALIAGGLLAYEAVEVAAAFAEHHGLREAARRHGGEWAALLMRR